MSKDIQIESNYQTHLKELYWELLFPAHKWSVLNIMWKKDNKLLIQLIDFENSKYNKNAIWLWNIIILIDVESRDFKFIWLVSEFFKWY